MIYIVITNEDYKKIEHLKEYSPASLQSEGFIHCSLIHQTEFVGNRFYKDATDVQILSLDENKIISKVVYEDLSNLGDNFPHIYGPLNMDAVVAVTPYSKNKNGLYELPENLK